MIQDHARRSKKESCWHGNDSCPGLQNSTGVLFVLKGGSMQNYEFDPATGELLSVSRGASGQLDQGHDPDRISSTRVVPPDAGENEKAVWNGKTWELKPDFRGKRYYQRMSGHLIECILIRELGEKMPADAYARFEDIPLAQTEKAERLSAEVAALLHRVSGQPEYDHMSIMDAKSHAGSEDPEQALQARSFILWERACWDVFYSMTSDIENLPQTVALLSQMPEFVVPFEF